MLEKLRKANKERHIEWAKGNELPLSFRGLELGGEAGEVCNELKKLERGRLGIAGGKTDLEGIREELADVIICADLVAMDLGIDLGEAIINKFNKTSDKYGLKTKNMKTQTVAPPPKPPNNKLIGSGYPDFIRVLGDTIASLNSNQSSELSKYLNRIRK